MEPNYAFLAKDSFRTLACFIGAGYYNPCHRNSVVESVFLEVGKTYAMANFIGADYHCRSPGYVYIVCIQHVEFMQNCMSPKEAL